MIKKNITIVFLHGLLLNRYSMSQLESKFQELGYNVRNFRYKTVDFNKDRTLDDLHKLISCIPFESVYLIGHSMGGLVARLYQTKFNNPKVQKIVTLGTPHNRSKNAEFVSNTKLNIFLGTCGDAGILTHLPQWESEHCLIGTVIGNKNIGINLILSKFHKHNADGDGTVFVEEAKLEGSTDSITLNVTHMEMLLSKEVFLQTSFFLENNKFNY